MWATAALEPAALPRPRNVDVSGGASVAGTPIVSTGGAVDDVGARTPAAQAASTTGRTTAAVRARGRRRITDTVRRWAARNGKRRGLAGEGESYSPRTRLMMSVAMLPGTSWYTANCMVYVARPWVRDRRSVE